MQPSKGRFITIEGVEGMGKSTAMQVVKDLLSAHHIDFVTTREPGGTPIAEKIRQILLEVDDSDEILGPDTELLLFFAGRAQNISQVIRPALQRSQWVISDRFTDASFAYQGSGRGIPLSHIRELAEWVQGDLQPNLTLLLDAPVEIGLNRLQKRGAKDRIEKEGVEFFERVRERYLIRAEKFPERFRIIKADQDIEAVKKEIIDNVRPQIEEYQMACMAR